MIVKRIASVLPLAGLLLASGLVVVLARQLRATREERDRLATQAQMLQRGAYVPVQSAPTLDGSSVVLGEVKPGGRQVVFVYNTDCPYCEASIPAWHRVADRLRRNPAATVVAVSLDSMGPTRRYAQRHNLRYASAVLVDPRAASLFRFATVPQTLVIDERGRVLHSRLGQLDRGAADSVLAAVARPLPGPRTPVRNALRKG